MPEAWTGAARHPLDEGHRPPAGWARRLWWLPCLLLTVLVGWSVVPVVQFDDPLSTVLLDREGELLGATIAEDGQWRFGIARTVPERFVAAITCFEDRRFFSHPGVDPLALLRAFGQNLGSGRVVSGGSTLTMQVVRLARRGRPRTYAEKAIEAVLAVRLSAALSKAQVLGLYAAYAPFGGNIVGLDAAAWRYFGRPAGRLSWAETATLAVLPNAPSLVHPGRNRDHLREKRDRLLDALRERGVIDATTADLGKREPLPSSPGPLPRLAPHLLERVRDERRGTAWRTGEASPWVRTTLEGALQERTTAILVRHHRALAENGIHNAAALVAEVQTGRILAYVGNVPFFDQPDHGHWVDVLPAPRSTGSILKPLLFAAMLDAGEVLPGQLVPDVPTHLGSFHPENFDRTYSGAVPAEQALARSLNVPAVRLLRGYGAERFTALLRRAGLTTIDRPAAHYGLSLILGGAEGTLFDVTGVYAGLGRMVNRAAAHEPLGDALHPLVFLESSRARLPLERSARPPIGPGAAWLTLQAMLEVERPGDEFAWRAFASSRRVAWKTGTSYGFRDAWAVGVTPQHVVGVWVGNADGEGRPGLTGYAAAAPILFDVFDLLPGSGWFEQPPRELVDVEVCARSGMRRGRYCAEGRHRLVTRAALDSPPCAWCQLAHLDAREQWQVHGDCEAVAAIRSVPRFVLPPPMEAHYRLRHADYRPLPPLRPDCRGTLGPGGSGALALVSPREDAVVYVPIEMDGKAGRVVFEAAHRDPGATVFWHLDGEYQGETRDLHQMALCPSPGPHVLTLVDEAGETFRRRFTVLGRGDDRRLVRRDPARRPDEPRRPPRRPGRGVGGRLFLLRRDRPHRPHRPARPRGRQSPRGAPGGGDAGSHRREGRRAPDAGGAPLRARHRRPQLPRGDRDLHERDGGPEARSGHRHRGGTSQHPGGHCRRRPVFYATGSGARAFSWSFLSGLAEPVGALFGYLVLSMVLGPSRRGLLLGAVAGIMVFISLDELLPTAREYGEHPLAAYGLTTGMAVMAFSLLLLL